MKRGNLNWLVVFIIGLLVLIVILSFLPAIRNAANNIFEYIGRIV